MGILRLRNAIAVVILGVANACWAANCPEFPAVLVIENWSSSQPARVELFQYKKNSDFRRQDDAMLDWNVRLQRDEKTGSSRVLITPSDDKGPWLPVEADYRLVVDGAIEYKITKIVSSNKSYAGCPLESAVVNTCQASAFRAIVFPQSCGNKLEAK